MSNGNGVWVAFPTCNSERAADAIGEWKKQGYRVAILTDGCGRYGCEYDCEHGDWLGVGSFASFHLHVARYPGYFRSVNALAKAVLATDPDFRCLVAAADDMRPDPSIRAEQIADEFLERFPDGYGVMQPHGDDLDGTDRIAGSPWMGRGWIERAYGGRGPLCEEFMQFYGDEQVMIDALALGVFWSRPDLSQKHLHWIRPGCEGKTKYQCENSDKYWAADQRTFKRRRAEGLGA